MNMGEMVLPEHLFTANIDCEGRMYSRPQGVPPGNRKRAASYGSHSIDSGVGEGESGSAFVFVLDSALNSPPDR